MFLVTAVTADSFVTDPALVAGVAVALHWFVVAITVTTSGLLLTDGTIRTTPA
jgi:hypothetical protein